MSEEAEIQQEEHEEQQASAGSEVEKRARTMGWVPKEEFKGDPERWRPADEFVERGESILPILKERNEKLTQDIAELKSTMAELRQFYSKSEQRQYERALKDLKVKQKQAVEDGDTEAFDKIDKEIESLTKDVNATKTEPTNPAYEQWVKKNDWYLNDPELHAYAESMGEFIKRTKPHLVSSPAVFDEITKLVKKQYPDKFENPERNGAAIVESAAKAGRGKAKRSFDSLPQEAKEQCKKFERTIPGFKKDEYVKNFDWDGYEQTRK